jgi:hypothetical protein
LGAGHPAAADRRFARVQQNQRQPERTPHRRECVVGVQMDLVGTLQRLNAVVLPTGQIRRRRDAREIVAVQCGRVPAGLAKTGQGLVGRHPLATLVSLASLEEVIDDTHRASPKKEITRWWESEAAILKPPMLMLDRS